MTPTKYELAIKGSQIQLRLYAKELEVPYSVIDGSTWMTGKSLAGLRKSGAKKAKSFNVPFIDLTVE